MISSEWTPNQPNTIVFVMVDNNGVELAGLGTNFTVYISKAGGALTGGLGAKAEIGMGGYRYVSTAAEADTPGPVFIVVTAAGAQQQNLEYTVGTRVVSGVNFTYTITDSSNGNAPISGVTVWITTDIGGSHVVWTGKTDTNGVARDIYGNLPWLDPATYYFWSKKSGYVFANQPDAEVVS